MLIQRERENSLEDSRLGYHTVARKAGRSPQLRLRFGKRGDYQYSVTIIFLLNRPFKGQQIKAVTFTY